jgi:hypothetical protein
MTTRLVVDDYSDPPPDQTDTPRERIAYALFCRRGFRADAWREPGTAPLRRDCRYLADAALEALEAAR